MVHDFDILIFKDAILGLLKWTEVNKRAFRYDEIVSMISKSVGVGRCLKSVGKRQNLYEVMTNKNS